MTYSFTFQATEVLKISNTPPYLLYLISYIIATGCNIHFVMLLYLKMHIKNIENFIIRF